MLSAKYSAINPLRSPRWRADRAIELIESGDWPWFKYDDTFVRAYRYFLLSLAEASNEHQRTEVGPELPALYQAEVWRTDADTSCRDFVEARLLTGESFAEIGRRLEVDPAAVEYYARLFFDVTDRLKASAWISKAALGLPGAFFGDERTLLHPDRRGDLLKVFAYYGGPLVLDALLGDSEFKRPQGHEDQSAWFSQMLDLNVTNRAIEAAFFSDISGSNDMRLLKLAVRMRINLLKKRRAAKKAK